MSVHLAPRWLQRVVAVAVSLFALMAIWSTVTGFVLRNDPIAPTEISSSTLVLLAVGAVALLGSAIVLWTAGARRFRFVLVAGAISIVGYCGSIASVALTDPAGREIGVAAMATGVAVATCAGILWSALTRDPADASPEVTT